MSFLFIYLTFLFFGFLILQIRLVEVKSIYLNAMLNAMLLTALFAVFNNGIHTSLIIPLLLIAGYLIYTGCRHVQFSKEFLLFNLITVNIIFVIFFFLFFRNGELFVPHPDFFFPVRVGVAQMKYHVENMGAFYNFTNPDYPKTEFYHYFEIWLMNAGSKINGQNPIYNLFFFSFPTACLIVFVAIRELVLKFNHQANLLNLLILPLLSVGFLMFFSHPWETTIDMLHLKKMPSSNIDAWWCTKNFFIAIALCPLIFFNVYKDKFWLLIPAVSLFYYQTILPIVIVFILLASVLNLFKQVNSRRIIIYYIIFSILFVLFYFNKSNDNSIVHGADYFQWLRWNTWKKYMPGIMIKTFFLPVLALLPALFYFRKSLKKIYLNPVFLQIILLLFICIGVWMFFVNNIDANQAFYLIFSVVFASVLLYFLFVLFNNKRNYFFLTTYLLYSVPSFVSFINHSDIRTLTDKETVKYLKSLPASRIVFIPDSSDLRSVYDFNEVAYTGIDPFVQYNDKLEIASLSAAVKTDTTRFTNEITLKLYQLSRASSPYYKKCAYVDFQTDCFKQYLIENKINLFCIPYKNMHYIDLIPVYSNDSYSFFTLDRKQISNYDK